MIYYLAAEDEPILALLIYAKNEQDNIDGEQRKALPAVIAARKAATRTRKKGSGT